MNNDELEALADEIHKELHKLREEKIAKLSTDDRERLAEIERDKETLRARFENLRRMT